MTHMFMRNSAAYMNRGKISRYIHRWMSYSYLNDMNFHMVQVLCIYTIVLLFHSLSPPASTGKYKNKIMRNEIVMEKFLLYMINLFIIWGLYFYFTLKLNKLV